ncbi:MAG TPA: hypothetical protein VKB50_23735 [Vicinamibacterales bacterium]|nr:hypothetical protein [Vicinamibacterales bacterium]
MSRGAGHATRAFFSTNDDRSGLALTSIAMIIRALRDGCTSRATNA